MKRQNKHNRTASVTLKILGGISFHVLAENWKHLKDTLAFSSFLVCKNRNRILLTSDLLPNISLVSVSRQWIYHSRFAWMSPSCPQCLISNITICSCILVLLVLVFILVLCLITDITICSCILVLLVLVFILVLCLITNITICSCILVLLVLVFILVLCLITNITICSCILVLLVLVFILVLCLMTNITICSCIQEKIVMLVIKHWGQDGDIDACPKTTSHTLKCKQIP